MIIVLFDPDHALRQAAIEQAREIAQVFEEIVPLRLLRGGFKFAGGRVSFGSFMKGIHRAKAQRGPGALSLMTVAFRPGQSRPYDDVFDPDARAIHYHYRAGSWSCWKSAYPTRTPGAKESSHRKMRGGTHLAKSVRRYHQARFRRDVLRAYRRRCAVCALREPELVQASHIIRDTHPEGITAVVNGIALCAIHHLAYDRNLLGIDPTGMVHIGARLLREVDGPMLRSGIQGFHGSLIQQPVQPVHRPDPDRLAIRFEEFEAAA